MKCPDCGGKKHRRNPDLHLRELERQYAGGDFQAGVRLLRLLIRSGFIPVDYVRRAAALGDARAQALGLEPWPARDLLEALPAERFAQLEVIYDVFRGLPKTLIVSFAADAAERVLYAYEDAYPRDTRPRDAIEAARRWVEDPSEENAYAAYAHSNYAAFRAAIAADTYAAAYAANAAAEAAKAAAIVPPEADEADEAWADDAYDRADWAASRAPAATSAASIAASYAATYAATDDDDAYYAARAAEEAWQNQRLIQYLLGEI